MTSRLVDFVPLVGVALLVSLVSLLSLVSLVDSSVVVDLPVEDPLPEDLAADERFAVARELDEAARFVAPVEVLGFVDATVERDLAAAFFAVPDDGVVTLPPSEPDVLVLVLAEDSTFDGVVVDSDPTFAVLEELSVPPELSLWVFAVSFVTRVLRAWALRASALRLADRCSAVLVALLMNAPLKWGGPFLH